MVISATAVVWVCLPKLLFDSRKFDWVVGLSIHLHQQLAIPNPKLTIMDSDSVDPEQAHLDYFIHHVFMPPKLPQSSDYTIEKDHALCAALSRTAVCYYQKAVDKNHTDTNTRWQELLRMLEHLTTTQRFKNMLASDVETALKSMELPGSFRTFLIRAQNAAVICRKTSCEEVVVESFEVTPPREHVMAGEGKIIRSFPGPAITVPVSRFEIEYFRQEFSSFLTQMNSDVLDSVATTKKAGSVVVEVKDSAHPRYITSLLTGILRGVGSIADVSRIQKRMSDDVLYDRKGLPWRRSAIWLVLRVAVQTHLQPLEYKSLMLDFMLDVLEDAVKCELNSEVLFCMRSKVATRLHKLSRDDPPQSLIKRTSALATEVKHLLASRWTEVQSKQAQSSAWDPDVIRANAEKDTQLSLTNSREYITKLLEKKDLPPSSSGFHPSHTWRQLENIHNFNTCMHSDILKKAFRTDTSLALADFEMSVQSNLKAWVDSKLSNADGTTDALFNMINEYTSAARDHYSQNQEGNSIMMLTLFELWVALDRIVVHKHPLLAKYSPEIPCDLFVPLLLSKEHFIEQLKRLLRYLQDRHNRATCGTVFRDGSSDCFAFQYFSGSPALQRLKSMIERHAAETREQRREDYRRLRKEYNDLQNQASRLSHTYYKDRWGFSEHASGSRCEKCNLESKAENLQIDVHEWPLPDNWVMAIVAVFELQCPDAFNIWREATYMFLRDLCMARDSKPDSAKISMTLYSYSSLVSYKGQNDSRERRITLASETASFIQSKYGKIKISQATSEERIIVNNGLNYRLYDRSSGLWAANPFLNLSISSMCVFQLPKGAYQSLQFSVPSPCFEPNKVISEQYHCNDHLSLHEFLAFGNLRSGHRLQWLNILKELNTRTLTFHKEEVHLLMIQTCWQIGTVSWYDNSLEWHEDLSNSRFITTFGNELSELLKQVQSNWMEVTTVRTIVVLCCRLLTCTVAGSALSVSLYQILHTARQVLLSWMKQVLSQDHPQEADTKQILKKQQTVCEIAFTCRGTYDVEHNHLKHLMKTREDVSAFVESSIRIFDDSPTLWTAFPPHLARLYHRNQRLAHSVEPYLLSLIKTSVIGTEGVDQALQSIWPAYRHGSAWAPLSNHNRRWITSSTSPDTGSTSQSVHLNILDGQMLVDGKPLSRLPREITSHETFTRVFGSQILDILPSDSGLDFATRSNISGYQVHFMLRSDELVICAKKNIPHRRGYQLIPHQKLQGDFPYLMIEESVHWLNLDDGEVEFRPLHEPWISSGKNWKLQFDARRPCFMSHPESALKLVDIKSCTARMISKQLGPFESHKYMTITFSKAAEIQVELPRSRMAFFVGRDGCLESVSPPNMFVDESVYRNSRRILIPHGAIHSCTDSHHVSIRVDTGSSRHVRFQSYVVRDDIGILEGNGSMISHLYKVYLHALTSHCLSDPLTGRTGTEEALKTLSSSRSRSFQVIQQEDLDLLSKVASLTTERTFYPEGMEIMQTVHWNKEQGDLPVLSQHPQFRFSVADILEYCSRFSKVQGAVPRITSSRTGSADRLNRRELSRNFHCYIQTETSCKRTQTSDHSYLKQSRDIDACFEKDICDISTSVCSGRSSTDVDLWQRLTRWSSIPGPTDATLAYSTAWLKDTILRKNWLTLYDKCRDATTEPAKKRYRCLFSLPSLAYISLFNETPESDCHELIPVLVQFLHNPEYHIISPPLYSCYNLEDGIKPTQIHLRQILEEHQRPFEESHWYNLQRRYQETEYDFDRHRRDPYDEAITSTITTITKWLLKEWNRHPHPTNLDFPEDISNIQLFRRSFLSKAKSLFESCIRNEQLKAHISAVQAILNKPQKPLLGVAAPYQIELREQNRVAVPQPPATLEPLLKRKPPQQDTAASLSLLSSLASHFDTSSAGSSKVHQVLGRQLHQSIQALAQQSAWSCFNNPSLLDNGLSLISYQEQCMIKVETLHREIEDTLSPQTNTEKVLAQAELWPKITPHSLLMLLSFKQRRRLQLPGHWLEVLRGYGQALVELQRSRRLHSLYDAEDIDGVLKEMANDQPKGLDNLDGLLIQISGDFLAQDIQVQVAEEMMHPSSGSSSVLQLNMGEGKSSVIVPIIAASLADGQKLVRVVVLKSLSVQMFQLLVDRVCGLADRRIFYMPFSRDLKVDESMACLVRSLYEECMTEGGILVIQPEHILSFRLMGLECLLTDPSSKVSQELLSSHHWLCRRARDILDESDELLHSRYQLIYTMGKQRLLENHPNRWVMIQDVFSLLLHHAKAVREKYPQSLHIRDENRAAKQFPIIQITSCDAEEELLTLILGSILEEGRLSSYAFERLPQQAKLEARVFISQKSTVHEEIQNLLQYCKESAIWSALLLLRGLFAHGILAYVLRHRRWRVDYGLDIRRTLLAVPYRAKDVPSLRAEFGHPDVAISLTCLSYYYGGLNPQQLDFCFEILMKSDNPAAEYAEWAQGVEEVPSSINGINFKDYAQRVNVLVPHLSRNRSVINFFLSQVVFPKYAKEFPEKLTTSGWDLAETRDNVTTGFSGTKDSQWLLPASISQCDPLGQEGTNAMVLEYLLRAENKKYECVKGPDNENLLAEQFLQRLVGQTREIRVLLDVGAQILDLANKDVARKWLQLKEGDPDVSAAVYFDENDRQMVIDWNGNIEALISSQYKSQLGRCLIYLDDAHTRGTDFKLPKEYRAAVTLGPRVTKDRLTQGCMRMRKLGHGQSVMFFALFDIDQKIRGFSGLDADAPVSSEHVVTWALEETVADIQHYTPHWLKQGIDYIERKKAWDAFESSGSAKHLTKWLQPEARTLEDMYGIGEKQSAFVGLDFESEVYEDMRDRCNLLGWSVDHSTQGTTVDEEQEREVANENEVERQIERPPMKEPAQHNIHDEVRRFLQTGIIPSNPRGFSPLFKYVPAPLLPNRTAWDKGLLSTVDFAITIRNLTPAVDDYMRPVTWVLSGGRLKSNSEPALVIISPYEANELRTEITTNSVNLHLHLYAPRVIQQQHSLEDLRFHTVPAILDSWTPPNRHIISQLNIFSGQLYLRDWDTYKEFVDLPDNDRNEALEEVTYQSDGFVKPGDRNGKMQTMCAFEKSPLPALKELFGSRRKGNGYNLTHIGRIVRGRVLGELDFK
ncbi:hypothetical protein K435DRAFT_867564 [Dendrothele bispora CBS 962.96]|uniref:ubiquitinyl hydrolase 1 n=1 Tax=Dendrothele bispora (strain CBS 962.96) TaxID=1314807 RepID=A0A4S8LEF8_DENBC|nr:hypothetical protein K435DRAFT_867564 [Dendrothele bispora CBS 962.96]